MFRKNIAVNSAVVSFTVSLTGDIHVYSNNSINNINRALNKFRPSINFSVGDFPHDFYERDLQHFKYLDLAVPGNHEFYKNSYAFEEIRYTLPFVSVSSFEYQHYQLYPSYRLFNIKGKMIAAIGLNIFSEVENPAKKSQFSILPFKKSLLKAADLTKQLKDRVDFFIYLSHCGLDNDIEILKQIPVLSGISTSNMLILGGHNHIVNPMAGKALESRILHSGTDLQYLGLAKISFDQNNDTKVSLMNVPLEDTKKVIFANSYPIKSVNQDLGLYFNNNDFFHVSPIGAIFTDKVRRDSQADVVIVNSGCLRDGLSQDYLQKYATDVAFKIIPFPENYFVSFYASKRQIIKIIKKELDVLNINKNSFAGRLGDKAFFQVSGLSYSFKKNLRGKYRLNKISIQKNPKNKEPHSPNMYKVVLPNFLFDVLKLEKIIDKNKMFAHEAVQFPLARFLEGNSLETIRSDRRIYKRKILED